MSKTKREQFLLNWDEGDTDNPPTKMERKLDELISAARKDERSNVKRIIQDRITEIDRESTMSAGSDRKRDLVKLLKKLK